MHLHRLERMCLTSGCTCLTYTLDSLARMEVLEMESVWTLQDAKNRFSEVVEHALHEGPQTITRRGKETAVMLSISAFRALSGARGDLVRFFRKSPLAESELDLERKREYTREVGL